MEGEIQRNDGIGRDVAEGARGREPAAQEAAGGIDAGRVGAEESSGKNCSGLQRVERPCFAHGGARLLLEARLRAGADRSEDRTARA